MSWLEEVWKCCWQEAWTYGQSDNLPRLRALWDLLGGLLVHVRMHAIYWTDFSGATMSNCPYETGGKSMSVLDECTHFWRWAIYDVVELLRGLCEESYIAMDPHSIHHTYVYTYIHTYTIAYIHTYIHTYVGVGAWTDRMHVGRRWFQYLRLLLTHPTAEREGAPSNLGILGFFFDPRED